MGAVGAFQVIAIEPCPEMEEGTGRLVTGWFHHRRGIVYNIHLVGESRPIGVTLLHPFWSVDRAGWISIRELRIGERLYINGGTTVFLGLEERGEEPVFNLEVDADHCYRVGEQGILVHNASTPCDRLKLDWNAPTLWDRWKVHTINKAVEVGNPPMRQDEKVVSWTVAWIKSTDLRTRKEGTADYPGDPELVWVQQVVGLHPSPPYYKDDRGHVIAHTLGGHGRYNDATHPNIFPQDTTLNTMGPGKHPGPWYAAEERVRIEASEPCDMVCVRVVLTYPTAGNSEAAMFPARPQYFSYEIWTNGVQVLDTQNIINVIRRT